MDCVVGPEYKRLALEEAGAGAAEAGAAAAEAKDWTLALPDELLEIIFGYSSVQDLGRAACVCQRWKRILVAKIEKFIPIVTPTVELIQKLVRGRGPFVALSVANRMPAGGAEQSGAFLSICSRLVEDGTKEAIDNALDLCKKIDWDRREYNQAYEAIFSKLAEMDNGENNTINTALQLIDNIEVRVWKKGIFIGVIVEKLVEKGDVDKALTVANTVSADYGKLYIIRTICKKLVVMGETEQAITVAKDSERAEDVKSEIFTVICEKLAEKGDIKKALEVAEMISPTWEKDKALECICRKLVTIESIEEALEIVETKISDAPKKTEALKYMAQDLLKMEKPDEALQIVRKMRMQCAKREALLSICVKYKELGNIDQAEVVANMIPDNQWEKTKALFCVSDELIGRGDLERALQVANKLPDGWHKSNLLAKLQPN